jgi:prepilin-type processing-associated H-X9-DG protein
VVIRALYTLPNSGVPVAFADGHVEILGEPIGR